MTQNGHAVVVRNISEYCRACKGECWNSKNEFQTQQNALKKFGFIPNACVNDSNGRINCPATMGLV